MAARKQLSFWSLLPRKVKRQHWPGCFNIKVERRHNPHTTPAPAHQSQLTQLVSGNFIIQLTDTTGDAGSTFSAALYGHSLRGLPLMAQSNPWHRAACSHHCVCQHFHQKKITQCQLMTELLSLVSAAHWDSLSQVELYYSVPLSVSLSQHSN